MSNLRASLLVRETCFVVLMTTVDRRCGHRCRRCCCCCCSEYCRLLWPPALWLRVVVSLPVGVLLVNFIRSKSAPHTSPCIAVDLKKNSARNFCTEKFTIYNTMSLVTNTTRVSFFEFNKRLVIYTDLFHGLSSPLYGLTVSLLNGVHCPLGSDS